MRKTELLKRIDDVIKKGEATVNSVDRSQLRPHDVPRINPDDLWVKGEVASAFRTAGLRVLEHIYGKDQTVFKDFDDHTRDKNIVGSYKKALALINEVRDEIENRDDDAPNRGLQEPPVQKRHDAVFLVHGHDDAARELVARFLEKLGIRPLILHEQRNQGRTVIEKLEHHSDVAFAVVLLTPDDVGGKASEPENLSSRARQNVILELGFFVGKLGRARVCALHKGNLELPSDIVGVVYVPLDELGGWQLKLAKELNAAGLAVDGNSII